MAQIEPMGVRELLTQMRLSTLPGDGRQSQ